MTQEHHAHRFTRTEEAITVLYCLIDDTYAKLNPRGRRYESLHEGQTEATWAMCALIGYLTKLHKVLSVGALIEVEEEEPVLIRLRYLPNSFCTSTSVDRILVYRTVTLISALSAIVSLLAYY